MKTTDLFKANRSSQRLNEGLEKFFGKKLNLESFDLQRLEDARNKLRTQISQARSESGFNENLENDAYSQAQWMLDAINAEIAERQEFIADAGTAEVEELSDFDENEVIKLLSNFTRKVEEIGAYGDINYKEILDMLRNGNIEDAVDEIGYSFSDQDGGEVRRMEPYLQDLQSDLEYVLGVNSEQQNYQESIQGDNMRKLTEGEIQQASAIVTAKTMVDRVGRWIEELSGMENDTLLQLGDQIRDEMSAEQAKTFISTVAPAIQSALDSLKQTRETLSTGVRTLTGEEQPAEMLGAEAPEGAEDELGAVEPDAMNMGGEEEMGPPEDEFAAAEPAAGGLEAAGREKRESIEFQNKLLKVLAG